VYHHGIPALSTPGENDYDFLRFLKNRADTSDCYGQSKYTGSSWPSLTVPADNFVAYFHRYS
jgi:hypothetical protein